MRGQRGGPKFIGSWLVALGLTVLLAACGRPSSTEAGDRAADRPGNQRGDGPGTTWTSQNAGTTDWLSGAAYGNNVFVAVGGGIVLTSPDGMTWTTRTSGMPDINGAAYGNNRFVAVGAEGTILTSG